MATKKRFYQVGVMTEVCVSVFVEATSERAALKAANTWLEGHEQDDVTCGEGACDMTDVLSPEYRAECLALGVRAEIEPLS